MQTGPVNLTDKGAMMGIVRLRTSIIRVLITRLLRGQCADMSTKVKGERLPSSGLLGREGPLRKHLLPGMQRRKLHCNG